MFVPPQHLLCVYAYAKILYLLIQFHLFCMVYPGNVLFMQSFARSSDMSLEL